LLNVKSLIYIAAAIVSLLTSQAVADDVYVRVNQLGYRPSDVKVAVAMSRAALPAEFQVVEASTQKVVFNREVRAVKGNWGKFDRNAQLDFSALKKQGEFFARVGDAKSSTFRISASIYHDVPYQLLEFMRQQRCGYNPWVDAVCHSFDGRTVDGVLPAGSYVDARGGWHDAGDQLKYLLTSSNATAQMLLAYQLGAGVMPSAVGDRVNGLGQAGPNGIPDLLDEAKWGLDWMLRLHPGPEQLYHQVADDRDHTTGFRLPQDETADYGWGKGLYRPVYSADGKSQGLTKYKSDSNGIANLAGRYAAAMGLCYQIWKNDPQMRPYAERCLEAGQQVYAMGKTREGVQQGNSYKSPYRYAETTWTDDMEWGAAELFRATGDAQYLTYGMRYAELAGTEGWFGKAKAGHYQYYPFMNIGHYRLFDLVDEKMRGRLTEYYRSEIESCEKASANNPFGIGVPFIWCSNNLTVALATECVLYGRMSGYLRYRAFGASHRDWLMGCNPWGFSMFTEIPAGGRFPRDVHLFVNAVSKKTVRGGLVDGPVMRSIFGSLKGVTIHEPDPLAEFQDERAVYHDDIQDYSTNEPTMDGTASAILMWVVLGGD
jgi:endoglucanase